MSNNNRRLVGPVFVGAATVTAATLTQLLPGVAAAATHHNAPTAGPSLGAPKSPRPDAIPATPATSGCMESSSPNYGCGKLTLQAQPVLGTFPDGSVPEVGGLEFVITGPTADQNTVTDDSMSSCETQVDPDDSNATCPESKGGGQNGAGNPTWVAGDQYSVALDAATTPPPANTLIPNITGTFPDCTAYETDSDVASGCPDLTPVPAYGTYHAVGLTILNSRTHKPVPKTTYVLCSATAEAPATGTHHCPSGTTTLATATSNSLGQVVFPSVYPGSNNYSVAPTKEPRGYKPADSQRLAVPVVTTAAEAGTLVQGTIKLVPIRPVVKTIRVTTSENKPIKFNALAGAKPIVGPLKLIKVGKPRHGSARDPRGRLTYKPRHGYVGKDSFTYTVRNGVGATATGRVVVHVKATSKRH